ncbi:ATP-dependent DNA helicase RecG [Brevundimonas diminuta]|uniref:ATP-dependent DNA helicase RecG n=1 Tax=Brevundimonas diminuta TaxID=293 RepID=UPI000207F7F9|nr:ATP-dependent DNA helicase RecG [Brevundimonas diminuta]EGF94708.1 DEAD/DEAH box helicase family protein [Brevundimonas diminuta ATCC 11568]OWR21846.1 ATP-dependent DNA helicase RecG [Brevundimonas diminuta]WQE46909.1 ATP-dependent DNA helicase RecG [Brevundimonas diminuta]
MRPEILFPLFADVSTLKGVGPRSAPLVQKVAGPLVRDVLFLSPSGVIQRRRTTAMEAVDGEIGVFEVTIDRLIPPHKHGAPIKVRAIDDTGFIHLIWFAGSPRHIESLAPRGARRLVTGKVERFNSEVQIAHPDYIMPVEKADEIPLSEPVYPATQGLTSRQIRKLAQGALALAPELPEWQELNWLAARRWVGWRAALEALHAPTNEADLTPDTPVRQRLAYDELFAHQLALARRRRARQITPAARIAPGEASARLPAALPFALTRAQEQAVAEIRADLSSGEQMGRLLQGDVGSGKTAVAALALADAASNGFQAALMAPTEILARQHYDKLSPLLNQAGVRSLLLTGRDTPAERRGKLAALASGEAQVAIGTHALFQDAVQFHRLALAVIDEQHRFGVRERQRLQAKGDPALGGVHLLTMSATPIPRTLELTQYGELEVSRLMEKPPGRTPVTTAVLPLARIGEVAKRLKAAVQAGAQAYWICPLVAESEAIDLAAAEDRAEDLRKYLGTEVGLAHGQMPGAEREAVMAEFADGRLPVLVATTVVEVGVDVPNASIMVIEHADRFGLAQLHQLRGRVGRGAKASACILLYGGEDGALGETAKERLETLRRTEDGFVIAEEDFRLRGGGDPLGLKQSGFPAYRFADPIRHRSLLLAAADDARLLLGRDPNLTSERGQAVRLLEALFDWKNERPSAD